MSTKPAIAPGLWDPEEERPGDGPEGRKGKKPAAGALPIAGHDGEGHYRIPKVTAVHAISVDGSDGQFPVRDDYSRRLAERVFLDERARHEASLDPTRGREVR